MSERSYCYLTILITLCHYFSMKSVKFQLTLYFSMNGGSAHISSRISTSAHFEVTKRVIYTGSFCNCNVIWPHHLHLPPPFIKSHFIIRAEPHFCATVGGHFQGFTSGEYLLQNQKCTVYPVTCIL